MRKMKDISELKQGLSSYVYYTTILKLDELSHNLKKTKTELVQIALDNLIAEHIARGTINSGTA
jgi:hypothetical protein